MNGAGLVSILTGIAFGVLSYPVLLVLQAERPGLTSLLAGLMFFVLSYPLLLMSQRRLQKRSEAADAKLPSPCTHRFSLNLRKGRAFTVAIVYLCEDCLCIAELDDRRVPMTIYPAGDLLGASVPGPNRLDLTLTEGRRIALWAVPDDTLLRALQERGWLPLNK